MSKDRKILIIAYAFPPWKSIGSIRLYNIAKQFGNYFSEIIALSSTNVKYVPNSNYDDLSKVKMHRLLTFDYKTFKTFFLSKKTISQSRASDKTIKNYKPGFKHKLLQSFPFNAFFGYGGLIYIFHGIIRGVIICEKNSLIFSSYKPLADHVIAYIIKCIKPGTYWIADYRDVYSFPDEDDVFFPSFQRRVHRFITKKANLLTVVSDGHRQFFNQIHHNTYTLRNGLSEIPNSKNSYSLPEKFTITYTGKLYGIRRDATIIFKALKKLIDDGEIERSSLMTVYAGSEGIQWGTLASKYDIPTTVKGEIPHIEALKLQRESSLNLLMNWNYPGLKGGLSGKLYEYLYALRPIIALINGSKDIEFEEIFDDMNCGIVVYDDESNLREIGDYLLFQYNAWSNQKPDHCYKLRNIEKYTWSYMVEELMRELSESEHV